MCTLGGCCCSIAAVSNNKLALTIDCNIYYLLNYDSVLCIINLNNIVVIKQGENLIDAFEEIIKKNNVSLTPENKTLVNDLFHTINVIDKNEVLMKKNLLKRKQESSQYNFNNSGRESRASKELKRDMRHT